MQTLKGADGNVYIPFFQPRYVFSNFYPCERLIIDGVHFRNTEQYFAYQKALFAKDTKTAEKILQTPDPAQAMTLSWGIKNFDAKGWDKISYEIMKIACLEKFQQNPALREELFKTIGAYLVEASPHSRIWGVGLDIDDSQVADPKKWRGSNKLGKVLMEVRDVLASHYADEAARFRNYYTRSRIQAETSVRKVDTYHSASVSRKSASPSKRDPYEIDSKDLVTLKDVRLGSGRFASVYKGILDSDALRKRTMRNCPREPPGYASIPGNSLIDVAVKVTHAHLQTSTMRDVLREIDAMKQLADNPHVLSLVAYVTPYKATPMLLLEYCANGNLQSFLKARMSDAKLSNTNGSDP